MQNDNVKLKIFKFLAAVFIFYFLFFNLALAVTSDELRKSIEEKAKKLQEVTEQIQSAQKQLDVTQGQKNSLQKELKRIGYSINQLNLGIKASQINIEKLGLELQQVQSDINDITATIGVKKLALVKLVRELYEAGHQNPLADILKHKSLAESFLENQSISSLNNGLSVEVVNLQELNKQLDEKFQETSSKKQKIEKENQNLKQRKSIIEDQKNDRQNLLSQTKNQEKLYANLIDNLSKQQVEISDEIEGIEKELRSKINSSLLPIPRPGVLLKPVDGPITQEYGYTNFARNGYRGHFHNGVDIGAPVGTEVMAAEDGKVVAVGNQDKYCYRGAYGKFIVIAHDDSLTTLYAHLSGQVVQKGDIVNKGQVIGYVGRTGYATGPHLHLTVYAGPTFYMGVSHSCGPMPYGGDLNPLDYLSR